MEILNEHQITFLANYFFCAHSYRQILVPQDYPESLKNVDEIAHQLGTNNTDGYALYCVITEWSDGLADPMLNIMENMLDLYVTYKREAK